VAGPVPGAVSAPVARPGLLDGVDAVPGRSGEGAASPEEARGTPPSFTVRGGPLSIQANLADLERGSALLASATDEALALSLRAGGWGSLMTLAAQQTSLARSLQERTAGLASGLLAVSVEAEVLHAGVEFSAAGYRTAEHAARAAFVELLQAPAFLTGLGLAVAGQPVPVPVTELGIHAAPEVIAGVLGMLAPGLGTGFIVASDTAAGIARDEGTTGPYSGPERLWSLATFGGLATGLVQLGPVRPRHQVPPADQWEERWTPGGSGPLTNLMDHLDRARAAEPGSVYVSKVDSGGPGASETVWLVSIPGTQSGDFRDASGWSTNPLDMNGNAEALVFDSQHLSAAVDDALREAGAGEGDALVLTGYSQGGIHATRMAADPRITAGYDVQGLFTVGSPTGEIAIPEDVKALHLEHYVDVVPGTDGRPNPQTANRTTITVHGYAEGHAPDGSDPLAGHSFENYRQLAEHVESSPEAYRSAPVLGDLAGLTAGGGASRAVSFERTRPGNPRNPLGSGSSSSFGSAGQGTARCEEPRRPRTQIVPVLP
jgi:hypothetical protein